MKPTTSLTISQTQSQSSSISSVSPLGTLSPGVNNQLGDAANISTIAGSVIGGVFACLTFVFAWLGFRKDRSGKRVVPEYVRRNLSHRGRWSNRYVGITCCAKEYIIIFDSVELELEYQTSTTKLYEFPLLKEEFSIVGKDSLTTFRKI